MLRLEQHENVLYTYGYLELRCGLFQKLQEVEKANKILTEQMNEK